MEQYGIGIREAANVRREKGACEGRAAVICEQLARRGATARAQW